MPELTEAAIHPYVTDKSFRRGRRYYRQGAVLSVARRGDQLVAEVQGSHYEPYRVHLTLDEAGLVQARCSCPYDWGGYCKHIVAVYLTAVHEPEEVEDRPTMETLLEDLSAAQLRQVLLSLADRRPGLADAIESQVLTVHPAAEKPSQDRERPAVAPQPFRRQVYRVLHSTDHMSPSEAYWHEDAVLDAVRQVLEHAWAYIENGDGDNALVILEAITDEYMKGWLHLDGSSGEPSNFFWELGAAWTEALLLADLTPAEGVEWAAQLEAWHEEVWDYGIDDAFLPAIEAAEAAGESLSTYEPGEYENLTQARLNVLERQERYDDYLELARASGHHKRYVTVLVRLGRIDEAVAHGIEHLITLNEALALAEALREQKAIDEALRVAEHGLELEGHRADLASWLRDAAQGVGRTDLARRAAVAAFRAAPNLPNYQAVASLVGEQWPTLRDELLGYLRQQETFFPRAQVDVFLHEGLVEDAIAAVEGYERAYDLVERVVEAALEAGTCLDWVIEACRYQAERIIEPGKSAYYHHAAHWLTRARDAYLAAGREDAWRKYLDDLLARHHRKYKLMSMLEPLKRQT